MVVADRGRKAVRLTAAVLVATSLALTGCSSDDDGSSKAAGADSSSSTTAAVSTDPGYSPPECDQGATTDDVKTTPVDGVASDLTLTSHDGTEIRMHWFPADDVSDDEPAPTVLMGPGWSLAGSVEDTETVMFGALDISSMNERGYNVLTWDPRGFGESGGTASVNDPELEGRDAQILLDWVAEQPEALTDDEGDPRVGMVGFSYGGGIQLTLSGLDCRVDAIVPGIAWNSLETALFRNETVKTGWAGILVQAASAGTVDPHIPSSYESGTTTGTLSDEDREWFLGRGPGELVDKIRVPTLLVQGTVDTLFTPDEAITNFGVLAGNDVPVKMLWFCGGHGVCLTDEGDADRVSEASFAWLDRWVKRDTKVDTGPVLDLIDQRGVAWTGETWPPKAGSALEAAGSGTLSLTAEGGSTGLELSDGDGGILGGLVASSTPVRASNALNVAASVEDDVLIVGAAELTITYKGTVEAGDRPMRVFAQLVDDQNDVVIGNQITPVPVELDGVEHTVTVPLESVIQYLKAGETITLQIVATTGAYAQPRLGGEIEFSSVSLSLPTTKALTETP
jgi:ABC-2 type transport system ATP-binding protein